MRRKIGRTLKSRLVLLATLQVSYLPRIGEYDRPEQGMGSFPGLFCKPKIRGAHLKMYRIIGDD